MGHAKLKEVLELHKKYLCNDAGGVRADLYRANLQGADLQGANLKGANLQGADLQGANLYRANLQGANLYRANLQGADLQGANLKEADLYRANLQGADLPVDIRIYQTDSYAATIHKPITRIGCQCHVNNQWRAFGDDEIICMAPDALEWWNEHKENIFRLMRELENGK